MVSKPHYDKALEALYKCNTSWVSATHVPVAM